MIIEEEDFLEHYGVKGMKWGVRRKRNRELNRASRARDKASPPKFTPAKKEPKRYSDEWKKQVDSARADLASGKSAHELKKAKFEYKKNKVEMGSREARKILRKARQKNWETRENAEKIRDGGEAAVHILNSIAAEFVRPR